MLARRREERPVREPRVDRLVGRGERDVVAQPRRARSRRSARRAAPGRAASPARPDPAAASASSRDEPPAEAVTDPGRLSGTEAVGRLARDRRGATQRPRAPPRSSGRGRGGRRRSGACRPAVRQRLKRPECPVTPCRQIDRVAARLAPFVCVQNCHRVSVETPRAPRRRRRPPRSRLRRGPGRGSPGASRARSQSLYEPCTTSRSMWTESPGPSSPLLLLEPLHDASLLHDDHLVLVGVLVEGVRERPARASTSITTIRRRSPSRRRAAHPGACPSRTSAVSTSAFITKRLAHVSSPSRRGST